MTSLGEVPGPEFDVPLEMGEVEAFRDGVLLPAVGYLSHGRFDAETVTAPEQYAVSIDTLTPTGLVRHSVEAFCWINLNAESDKLGSRIVSVRVSSDKQVAELTEQLKEEAQQSLDPEGLIPIPFLDDDNEDLSAWETTTITFEKDGDDPVHITRDKTLQDVDGAVEWSEEEIDTHTDKCDLSIDERRTLWEMRRQMQSALNKSECAVVIDTLLALGLPREVLAELINQADLAQLTD